MMELGPPKPYKGWSTMKTIIRMVYYDGVRPPKTDSIMAVYMEPGVEF